MKYYCGVRGGGGEVEELERMWVRECTEDSDGPFVFVRTFCYICYAILTKIKDII